VEDGRTAAVSGDGETFEEWDAWMAFGLDEGSRLADPQFADPASDDYRLQEGSPAFDLGFEAIPTAQIGCYASPERASWPLEAEVTREVPLLYSQPVLPVREDFEIDLAGRPPRHGDVMADGESRIVVTDGLAAGGQQCLEIVDAPELRQVWIPRIYYPLDHQEGRVRLALSLRLSGDRPPQLYIDPRQYSDTGPAEYFSGPMLHVQQDGSLTAAGETLAQLPADEWVRLEMILTLGADAPGSTELTVQVPGAGARTVSVPHVHPEFGRLERLVIASVADGDALFHLDDIIIEPVTE
ncbi:MAG: hypothetical protein ACP5KN_15555, partial [Armatimonadota bacterium]